MALPPKQVHKGLTKRPERMWEYGAGRASKLARFMVDEYLIRGTKDAKRTGRAINVSWPVQSVGDIDAPGDITMRQWPLPNVWLGVSVEDQKRADERIPYLLTTPARSEEHMSELQSLMRISYAGICLKTKSNQMRAIGTM